MSFNFPASVELEIQQYAEAEHLSVQEAATRLILDGLALKGAELESRSLSDADWQKLRDLDPAYAFFDALPEGTIKTMEETSLQIRAEELGIRG